MDPLEEWCYTPLPHALQVLHLASGHIPAKDILNEVSYFKFVCLLVYLFVLKDRLYGEDVLRLLILFSLLSNCWGHNLWHHDDFMRG